MNDETKVLRVDELKKLSVQELILLVLENEEEIEDLERDLLCANEVIDFMVD